MCVGNFARGFPRFLEEFRLGRNRYGNKSLRQDARNFVQSTFRIDVRIFPQHVLPSVFIRSFYFSFSYHFSSVGIRIHTNCPNLTFFSLCPRNVRRCDDDVGVERALIKLWCHHISRHCWVTGLGTRPSLWFYKYLRTFTTWDEGDRVRRRKLQKSVKSERKRKMDVKEERERMRGGGGEEKKKKISWRERELEREETIREEKACLSLVVRSSPCIPLDRKVVVY